MKVDWKEVDKALRRLAVQQAAHDFEVGQWLLAARRTAVHVHFGFAALHEYVERVLGYEPRMTGERLRVAEALERLPLLAEALRQGAVSWSAVREVTRVAVPETEEAWLTAAKGKTVRQVEELVVGRRPGDRPVDPPGPEPQDPGRPARPPPRGAGPLSGGGRPPSSGCGPSPHG
jgi:hypothetical protein